MKLLLKILLSAVSFVYLLPMIHGISFHGNFMMALGLAVVFGILLWVVDLIAIAISAIFTITSFGVALLWLIPLWILGFWLLPAVALKWLADFFPTHLMVAGWTPAIWGGLVLLIVGVLTSEVSDSLKQKAA